MSSEIEQVANIVKNIGRIEETLDYRKARISELEDQLAKAKKDVRGLVKIKDAAIKSESSSPSTRKGN